MELQCSHFHHNARCRPTRRPVREAPCPTMYYIILTDCPTSQPQYIRKKQWNCIAHTSTIMSTADPLVPRPLTGVSLVTGPSHSSPDRPNRHQTVRFVTRPSNAVSRVTRPSTTIPLVTRPSIAIALVTGPSTVVSLVTRPSTAVPLVIGPSHSSPDRPTRHQTVIGCPARHHADGPLPPHS